MEQDHRLAEQDKNNGVQGNARSFALAQEKKAQRIAAAQTVAQAYENAQAEGRIAAGASHAAGRFDSENTTTPHTYSNNATQAALDVEEQKANGTYMPKNPMAQGKNNRAILAALPVPQGRQNGVGNVPKDVANIQQRSIQKNNALDNAVLRTLPVPEGRQNGARNDREGRLIGSGDIRFQKS